jgi:hypothetical protein
MARASSGNGCACIDGPLKWNKGFPLEDANYFIPIQDSTAILPGGIKEGLKIPGTAEGIWIWARPVWEIQYT